jgi:arylsulfatase
VVIIFADDMGYGDVGCFGAKDIATPNLDRMATEGMRFTRFYVAQPVCSASRAALLTGCYPSRVGIQGALGPRSKVALSRAETTIADLLKTQGYATAIFGKWHLGDHPEFLPTRHGFDEYFGLPYSNDMWPFHPDFVDLPLHSPKRANNYPDLPLFQNDRVIKAKVTPADQAYLTTWYTEHAVKFIAQNRARPFFLYLAHNMPHVPLYVSGKFKGKSGRGLYGDVIMEIDWSVGQVLAALKKNGLDDRTLVIFTSDNGPWLSYGTHSGSSGGLREGKGTVWEGGLREPCIMRWPGKIPTGRECREPAMTIDLLPTIAGLAGASLPTNKIDGLDIWPMISGQPGARCPHEAFYFYYQNNQLQAVTSGRWKLMLPHTYRTLGGKAGGQNGKPVPYQNLALDNPELYDLEADPKENTDVAAAHPDEVNRLLALAEKARADLGDQLTGRKGAGARPPGKVPAIEKPAGKR